LNATSWKTLRGSAAIAVLLFHVGDQYKILFEIGAAGTDIFFVISGFIIWSTTSRSEISMPDYFWKRLTRVLRFTGSSWLSRLHG
jgi:exopolysaccharide production protein ExoZ